MIRSLVVQETRYLRHYWGKVVDNKDPKNKGKVKVIVPELGRNDDREGFWCSPRYRAGFTAPAIDSWVEIYFMNADVDRPVYIGVAAEFKDMKLSGYSSEKTAVLWVHPDGTVKIVYDQEADQLLIQGAGEVKISESGTLLVEGVDNIEVRDYSEVTIGGGSESYVLGDSLKTYLDNLKGYIDNHVHVGVTTGGGTSGTPSPSPTIGTVLSSKIKGE